MKFSLSLSLRAGNYVPADHGLVSGPHQPNLHLSSPQSVERTRPRGLQEQGTQGACASHHPKPLRDKACTRACGEVGEAEVTGRAQ